MKMKLGTLMREFIDTNKRQVTIPLPPGGSIIKAKQPLEVVPIVPTTKWKFEDKKRLVKCYVFETVEKRNRFLIELLQYEQVKGHNASMKVDAKTVEVVVQTHDVESVTELDKEYAREADRIFRDVVYCPVWKSTDPNPGL